MKTPSPSSIIPVVGLLLGSLVAITVFAQAKKDDPSTHGIRLILGHKGHEPLHCSEESLNKALSKCDTKTYKIKFDDPKKNVHWEKGELADVTVTMTSLPRAETGGASPAEGLSASGVNSTQQISFASTEDLKTFVGTLETAP